MTSESPRIRAWSELGGGFRSLVTQPFVTLLALGMFFALVDLSISNGISPGATDDTASLAQLTSIAVEVIGIYLQIAVVLAAGSSSHAGADPWIRAAFKHRCFWRYVAVAIVEVLLIAVGALALVVGGFYVGGAVSLSLAAVVLERRRPFEAIARSLELTRPVRGSLVVVFAVLLLGPLGIGVAASLVQTIHLNFATKLALSLAGLTMSFVAAITLTRIFVKLGGAPTPPVQTLLYKSSAGGGAPR